MSILGFEEHSLCKQMGVTVLPCNFIYKTKIAQGPQFSNLSLAYAKTEISKYYAEVQPSFPFYKYYISHMNFIYLFIFAFSFL